VYTQVSKASGLAFVSVGSWYFWDSNRNTSA
jgi:hypothetical protein